jgi:aspartate ammonia-lyase
VKAGTIERACLLIIRDEFVVDAIQGGAGTSIKSQLNVLLRLEAMARPHRAKVLVRKT